ncbi:hypothetical protein PR048_020269 [Dryococelus australis]|uniref:Uncharacterized protein n=1 Tax=Dryococelus australis TaxID=614101 RepID=A0ABQ9H5T8_9NEOP|nr:hypothetical protein PR048_020269 [Dryococelus australis]
MVLNAVHALLTAVLTVVRAVLTAVSVAVTAVDAVLTMLHVVLTAVHEMLTVVHAVLIAVSVVLTAMRAVLTVVLIEVAENQTLGGGGGSSQSTRLLGEPDSIPREFAPGFSMWESCRTIRLNGGFPHISPVSSTLAFRHCLTSTSLHPHRLSRLRQSCPNISTPLNVPSSSMDGARISYALYLGTAPALAWSDCGKPWEIETRTAGPRIEPRCSRMRAQCHLAQRATISLCRSTTRVSPGHRFSLSSSARAHVSSDDVRGVNITRAPCEDKGKGDFSTQLNKHKWWLKIKFLGDAPRPDVLEYLNFPLSSSAAAACAAGRLDGFGSSRTSSAIFGSTRGVLAVFSSVYGTVMIEDADDGTTNDIDGDICSSSVAADRTAKDKVETSLAGTPLNARFIDREDDWSPVASDEELRRCANLSPYIPHSLRFHKISARNCRAPSDTFDKPELKTSSTPRVESKIAELVRDEPKPSSRPAAQASAASI